MENKINITFLLEDADRNIKETIYAEHPVGISLLEAAQRSGIALPGLCEGSLACSTCHVAIDQQWFIKIPSASEDEEDMLDLAFGVRKTSRLSCQIELVDELDGMIVTIPLYT